MNPKPGIYPGVSFEEYKSWDAINNSLLEIILELTPAHARDYLDNPPDLTDAFRVGQAQHTLILEPGEFEKRYAVRPECDRRTKEGKAIYADFLDNLNGKTEITEQELSIIRAMDGKLKSKEFIINYVERGQPEVCIVWQDERTGLLCKARLDYYQKQLDCIIDLKTTIKPASLINVEKIIARFGYYQKAAFYCDGLFALTDNMPSFVFVFLEKNSPYECRALQLGDNSIIAGRKAYRKALKIYSTCLKSNRWPGWPDEVDIVEMPQWALNNLGVGQYNIISEDEENGKSLGQQIDWKSLEADARIAEGRE